MKNQSSCHLDHSLIKPWQLHIEIKKLENAGEHAKACCKFCGVFIKFLNKRELSHISRVKEEIAKKKFQTKKTALELSKFLYENISDTWNDFDINDEGDPGGSGTLPLAEAIFKFLNY